MNSILGKYSVSVVKRLLRFAVLCVGSLLLTGCSFTSSSVSNSSHEELSAEKSSKQISVVTSIAPLYAHVKSIGGDKVNVTNLVPPGDSVHRWQLRPSQLQILENADLIVINGRGLESFLEEYLQDFPDAIVLDTSTSLEQEYTWLHEYDEQYHSEDEKDEKHTQKLHEEDSHEDSHKDPHEEDSHDSSHGHDHDKDPHVRLDPLMAITQVGAISDALQDLDPENAQVYQDATQAYIQEIQAKHRQLADIWGVQEYVTNPSFAPFPPEYQFAAFHDAYGFFWRRYNLQENVFDNIQDHHEDQLSVQDMQGLVQAIQDGRVRVLITEPQMDTQLIDTLSSYTSSEQGLEIVSVSPVGTELSRDTYLSLLQDLYEKFLPIVQEANAG